MAELRLSEKARADLEGIRETGIETYGERTAEHHLAGFYRAFRLLADHPFAGQQRDEFRQDIRSISHRPHRILYSVLDDVVLIVRIIHQARDVAAAMRSEA